MSVAQHQSIHELADTLLEHARRGERGQLELHGLNPAVTVLISRTLDAEGAVAAAEDALARRQDSLWSCRQALRAVIKGDKKYRYFRY